MSEKTVLSAKTITDPALEPYFISMDEYCYTVKQKVIPTYSDNKKEYVQDIGHYADLVGVIKKIIKLKTNSRSFSSLKEYLQEYKQIQESITKQFDV